MPAYPEHRHRPPHAFVGEAVFITASTYRRIRHLATPVRRDQFQELLHSLCAGFGNELVAWVILPEHYHLVVRPNAAETVSIWLKNLHEDSSKEWNRQDATPGRRCWYQFWDTSLWTQGDIWSRVNYIHANPVRHGHVAHPADWPWSSYHRISEDTEHETIELLARFPAPHRLPSDDF